MLIASLPILVKAMCCVDKEKGNMLILTRRPGETIRIGDDVEVTVLEVKGNQVRIGITAPKDVAVHREEIYNKIREEQEDPLH